MERIIHPKTYVRDLERELRTAIGLFVLVAVVQLLIILVTPDAIAAFIRDTAYEYLIIINLAILSVIAAGGYLVQNMIMPAGMHIWIDEKLFGSLNRSNTVIFEALLLALSPAEIGEARKIPPKLKVKMTENIFAKLANDPQVFVGMVQSNLFRFWNIYWMLIYASVMFVLTSITSFAGLLLSDGTFVMGLFFLNTIAAAGCIAATIYLGSLLMRRSREIVGMIVDDRRDVIADMIRDHIDFGNPEEQAGA